MKTKTFVKKLVLNKKTIANFNIREMGEIIAGKDSKLSCYDPPTICQITADTCDTCNTCLGQVTCHFVSYCPYLHC